MLVPVSVFGTVPIVLYTGTCPAIQYDTRIHVHCPAIQYGTRIHVQPFSTVHGYMPYAAFLIILLTINSIHTDYD